MNMQKMPKSFIFVLLGVLAGFTQAAKDKEPYRPDITAAQRAAAEKLKQEAEGGSAEAQNELSKEYMEGKIFSRDTSEAARWARAAAERGLAEAQVNLAILYLEGTAVPRDYSQGFSWMQKAANQDDPKAAYNLGMLYGLGRGVTQNIELGVHWYLKAAENGSPEGAYKMGIACEQGITVPRDLVKAYMWYYISSRSDYYWSKEPLREIGPKIGPNGIDEARREGELWIKAHPKREPGPYDAP
jgi:TPR repeat protein